MLAPRPRRERHYNGTGLAAIQWNANEDTNMPQYAAAPELPLPKHAHRPEPIEPPSAPPVAPPSPGEPDTIPVPSPDPGPQPIEPIEPVAPPIGDPPPQPTQTPQASQRRPLQSLRMQL
ncbi:Hypothetical protein Bxe_A3375 [Paraburkholderia xenovorans LB400]|uniref:Uncharacterized protein n=2 Tax=Paraburkholderia xenovorans TaxID=36873 RepID=Q142X9_PARXL|nr:Hypothetical protein Bxe_A3375 [Paraburkholderia xenovorans LB400]